ncbi:hypothetical protein QQF64_014067 [Cirrhinus molitorella]|uniref:Uncharacterized protein n=1 Tax=Cirrhinus molitorella TaxID=172907 RepID=A0ABR3LV79_9TELE
MSTVQWISSAARQQLASGGAATTWCCKKTSHVTWVQLSSTNGQNTKWPLTNVSSLTCLTQTTQNRVALIQHCAGFLEDERQESTWEVHKRLVIIQEDVKVSQVSEEASYVFA